MIERNWDDPGLRAALGSSPPLEKMKMGHASKHWDFYCDDDGDVVAVVEGELRQVVFVKLQETDQATFNAYAARAIHAVNCHDELVEALKKAKEFIDDERTVGLIYAPDHNISLAASRSLASLAVGSALAKAKVQP